MLVVAFAFLVRSRRPEPIVGDEPLIEPHDVPPDASRRRRTFKLGSGLVLLAAIAAIVIVLMIVASLPLLDRIIRFE